MRTEIGQRIARQRRRRGLPQVVVANLVGRSESWLSQVERGLRGIDSHSVLVRLAEILDLEISQLTADEADREVSKFEAAAAVRDAMLRYETLTEPAGRERPRLTWLGHELRRVNRLYQGTRYDEAGRLLPGLIKAAEIASQPRRGGDRRAAQTLRALVYQSTTMILNRVGETELAWTAADRSLSAAQAAERPMVSGRILRCRRRARLWRRLNGSGHVGI
ncbi:MAG: helix-turn-helix transcriptional regulator [Streptosporangiaceae bacterium]